MIKKLNKILKKNIVNFDQNLILYYGINNNQKTRLKNFFGLSKNSSLNKLNYNNIIDIENFIRNNLNIEYNLKIFMKNNINKNIILKNYKGFRFRYKLPVKGQNTRVNRMTARKFVIPYLETKFIEDDFKVLKKYKLNEKKK